MYTQHIISANVWYTCRLISTCCVLQRCHSFADCWWDRAHCINRDVFRTLSNANEISWPQTLTTMTENNVIVGQSPTYISDTLTPVSRGPARGRLRSAGTTDYLVPKTRSKLGERAFCISGPLVWNSLPESLRTVDCIRTFCRQLKTQFFNLYLSWFYLYASSF